MRIIVTGATGFVGRCFVDMYSNKYNFILLVRKTSKIEPKLLKLKNFRIIRTDIDSIESIKRLAEELNEKIDCILHLAADTKINNLCLHTNIQTTRNTVYLAKLLNIPKIIFMSTDNVYCSYDNFYGKSKINAEKFVRTIYAHTIFRCTVIFGKNNERFLEKINSMINTLPILIIPGSGKYLLQPIFVKDVCKYLEKAIQNNIIGTFDLAGNKAISMNAFLKICIILKNQKKSIIHIWLAPVLLFLNVLNLIKLIDETIIVQLKNMNKSRVYNIEKLNTVFKIKQTKLEKALEFSITNKK